MNLYDVLDDLVWAGFFLGIAILITIVKVRRSK